MGPFPHGGTVSKGQMCIQLLIGTPQKAPRLPTIPPHAPPSGTWNHLQLQSEVLAKQRREQQEPCSVLVLAGATKRKTTICCTLRFKRESILKGAGEPVRWNWGGFEFQTNNGTKHRGRQTAEWLSGSSRNSILYYQKHRSPIVPFWFDFLLILCYGWQILVYKLKRAARRERRLLQRRDYI